ncbi:helix-turn-helix domain-containing protein [Longispora albida]|uniref:helix-turn-helix domain-containing protein n=1 Tax=Longispora albida TaxID=203523 RepID=UPI0003A2893D|nr:helix-turn-helix transcriptional regulator [Longispora albida]
METFGQALRRIRRERSLSLRALALRARFDFSYLGQIERGARWPSPEVAAGCDTALGTGGALAGIYAREQQARDGLRLAQRQPTPAHTQHLGSDLWTSLAVPTLGTLINQGGEDVNRRGFLVNTTLAAGGLASLPFSHPGHAADHSGYGRELTLIGPAGKMFTGSAVSALAFPASDGDRILAAVPEGLAGGRFLRRPQRGLVVGITTSEDGPKMYALDSRQARRRLIHAAPGAQLIIPPAYVLDDVTLGLVWAVANLDDALLGDDTLLTDCQRQLAGYETLNRSAAGRESAADLAAVSQAWLGSDFCARYILRHTEALTALPSFWTREQRGEEASTWLLFTHKYAYLQAVTGRFAATGEQVTRSFCIPPEQVTTSPAPERVLLLLAAALMESFGIRVEVTAAPEYTAVEGFVSDGRHAILANWVGGDSLWHVDVTTSRPVLREYADATGHTTAHSVITASDPARRLRSLAAYLDLNWATVTIRCAQLADYGLAGLTQPRSRLMALTGAERACEYLADLQHHTY